METLASSATIVASSPPSLAIFTPKTKAPSSSSRRFLRFPNSSKNDRNESDLRSDFSDSSLVPILSNRTISKDEAMGLVLSAALVGGWTTDSGMEGPSVPAGADPSSGIEKVSTFPWSLFTKSPRRRMRVAFSCNVCGQRTTRAINPHAYTDGTVFVQCCGCNVFHKLVDNLNLFHEMKCYVNPSFNYPDRKNDVTFKYLDVDDDDDDIFPIL
ncbi:Mitochondrial protein import protein [Actinidia chinensis var. chinensis]|uniref:Mitochondrial protein import protein n=1 Tax=Actinidia chinensis var. chinensis TaxID=1590841 RepID=A0A2R6PZG3_ACTCC|nr:Mitochondrial protein import protein [Actinidia chinensis var. chinensis]